MDISAALCTQPEFDADMFSFGSARPANKSLFQNIGSQSKEPNVVSMDHPYAKPWNAHPDSFHAHPAKMLFMKGIVFNSNFNNIQEEEKIDVTTEVSILRPLYDMVRAGAAMRECERYARSNSATQLHEDWEENIPRQGWTPSRKKLFSKLAKIINEDHLSRAVYKGHPNEPVMRRLALDKTASRVRLLFATVMWDMPTLQWLHNVLLDNLPQLQLAIYLDILQTLKAKIPTLIDKILQGAKSSESLNQILRRPWDPVAATLNHNKLKKLSGSPLIVWTPGDPAYSCVGQSKRMKLWHTQLSALGKLVTVNPQVTQGVSISDSLDAIIIAVRYEVMELKLNFPARPIILVGWTIGALIACQVALAEAVSAIVCLGFPLSGVNGSRGDLDDPLLESLTPTLFVVGQKAAMCSVDDIEDFRERMRAESGLVVIGGADDHLRVCSFKKRLDGISQAMVDRCILEEMSEFLNHILNNPNVSTITPGEPVDKRKRKNNSKDPDYYPPEPVLKMKTSKPSSAVPSRTVSPCSPASSSTETSSSGSSANDSTEKSPHLRHHLKRSLPTEPLESQLNRRSRMLSDQQLSAGGAQFFSQQLGLPVITPSISSPPFPPYMTPNNKQPNKTLSPSGLNSGTLSSSLSAVTCKPPQVASNMSSLRTMMHSGMPFSKPEITDGFKPIRNLMIPPVSRPGIPPNRPVVSNRSSNMSYLTVANPMLSSILDGKAQSLFGTKSCSPPSPLTSLPKFLTSGADLPSPKRLVPTDTLKTYMRSPAVSRTVKPGPQVLSPLVSNPPNKSLQLPAPDKPYVINQPHQNIVGHSSLLPSTKSQSNLQRKMQVITFLKPPVKKEKSITHQTSPSSPGRMSTTTPSKFSNLPDNPPTVFTSPVIANIQKTSPELALCLQPEELTPLTSPIKEATISRREISPEIEIFEKPKIVKKMNQTPLIQHTISETGDLTAFTCALTSSSFVNPNELEDVPVVSEEPELKVEEDVQASITDRLSHLSAGTQEAILALTQLSNFSEA